MYPLHELYKMNTTLQEQELFSIIALARLYHEKWETPLLLATSIKEQFQLYAFPAITNNSFLVSFVDEYKKFFEESTKNTTHPDEKLSGESKWSVSEYVESQLTESREGKDVFANESKNDTENDSWHLQGEFSEEFTSPDDELLESGEFEDIIYGQTSHGRFTQDALSNILANWAYSDATIVENITLEQNVDEFVPELETERYQCEECKKSYKRKEDLRRHVETHANKSAFSCQKCSKVFATKYTRIAHEAKCRRKRLYQCSKCPATFTLKSIWRQHEKKHAVPQGEMSCSLCGKKFLTVTTLNRHKRHCAGKITYMCGICKKQFQTKGNLNAHLNNTHSGVRPYPCRYCDKSFKRKSHKDDHERKLHMHEFFDERGVETTVCKFCGQEFKTVKQLRKHCMVNHPIREFPCWMCDQKLKTEETFDAHLKIVHAHNGTYQCPYCTETFDDLKSFLLHQSSHNTVNPIECRFCLKRFKYKAHLKRHMRMHTEEKPFMCDLCSRCFSDISNLITHKKVHQERKRFPCRFCTKGFKHRQSLVTHEDKHMGIKRFSCEHCGETFQSRFRLTNHLQKHLGVQFSCSLCGKNYASKAYLLKHEKTHQR